ncbi:isochorismatase family protein [Furfurilactobacillus curtus]|uniref:Isochorismatase-like domain-containing protein n=1 Tax=Furfurilactobacillus curtus TaxID=1746200 RepID=A0ABQ5JQZ3_9LACO
MLTDTLIVIDLQNGIIGNHPDLPAFLTRINQRIVEYRKAEKPILFIQHNDQEIKYGTIAWQLITGLDRQQTDIVIEKCHPNAFLKTDLLFQKKLIKFIILAISSYSPNHDY